MNEAFKIGGYTNDQVDAMLAEINRLYLIDVEARSEWTCLRIIKLEGMLDDAGICP